MKKLGFFLPFRHIIVLYQKGYALYRFRWGRCVTSKFYSQDLNDKILKSVTDILVAYPIQDLYLGQAPKLKYFDRPTFLYHALSQHFKTTKWIANGWLSATRFIGLKFSNEPNQLLDQFQGRLGVFIGEVMRCNIFKNGEGCLLAPTQFGQIYQIYLKNHQPHFVRWIDQDLLFNAAYREGEIDALKRYLVRHFQANSETLSIKWWGADSPEGIEIYQTQSFEQSIVKNYAGYLNPSLPFKSTISAHWFCIKTTLKKFQTFTSAISLILFFLSIKNSVETWMLKNQYQDLECLVKSYQKQAQSYEHVKQSTAQIKEFEEKKAMIDTLNILKPMMINPLLKLKKLSFYLKDQVRCHELIWLQGQMTIDSSDHMLKLHPTIHQQTPPLQSLILAITAPTRELLQSFEHQLKKDFSKDQTVKLWTKSSYFETSESQQAFEFEENLASGLLEMIEKQ